ncbi:putative ankyrin repeat domain-containing protein 26 isoform 5 [Scophthalmus maximus]|uniref:Putative ankyrin repeat domain-containing protein 26 n=1 Tax=Scophthalmus maximus TaxID=52904 RepID=A0A2U9BXI0_SCOMX|nr:putative ankyrin repeat domain-containing protein 26 [Scophthalmus maximus]AWP08093.1 putative ankyrin repeat domain-containing protein 26 isoform 2 [Scophthalmus maximus]AWP08094.1 putative ankyrin repeat domain-containing protein 26 isoform 3 [Scophthalmus maximus]AWP08095.1 putative ankyrin repeat domain-containing protein 26 isoform 4 [Scophthalmus maximus]AWP08096.1 putative ankyrin repeat domain-containing protein 26 isoform 5 [Scophthalmus maximus]
MKKIFSFTKKKKHQSGTPDSGSVLSLGYELKDKDLGKVHKAASVGDLAKLKQLAKKKDVNQLDKENRTALHIACASGHVEVVQFLVESKAKLNLCDNQNRSALMKTVQGQHERCLSILLENHAEPNLVDINGNTALHLAANIPSISIAILLLQHEANINAQNKEGFAPLTVAVREDHIEMAEFLLKESADVDCMDKEQRSPLMIAAGNGQIGMLRLLLRFNADISLKDTKGQSADHYAVKNGHHGCSLLIIEHGTQRNDGPSLSHQGLGKKKKKLLSGSPFQDVEAGFSLGGPATDKDDFEDYSQSESLSRVSKSATDEWPSSADDDDDDNNILLNKKKPQKVNLSKMIASKKGEGTESPSTLFTSTALLDRSLSGTESEPESKSRVQRIPSLPKTLPSRNAPQQPVDPAPISFLSKAPQMTSTPLSSYRKKEESIENEEDDDDDDDKEQTSDDEEEEEEEEHMSDENDQPAESGESLGATLTVPETEKDKKRDFLSELGLEKGQDEEDSWDTESHSEKASVPHEEKQSVHTQEATSTAEGVSKEIGNDNHGEEHLAKDDTTQKETEKAKWEPLSVLSKLGGDKDQKTDLMEELGLGDIDDLEDASDWDSASTTSKRTLPGLKMASPGLDEFPECTTPSIKEQDEDVTPAAPPTPQRSICSDGRLPSSPPRLLPHPQPRARKMVPQKPQSEEGSPELTSMERDGKLHKEPDEPQHKENDDAGYTCELDLNSRWQSGRVGSDRGENCTDLRDRRSPEERGEEGNGVPWEKRYEKLWVEVEKREVKSTFKNVAGELKEKFGELLESRCPAEDVAGEEQATADSTSEEEASSDEDEGEIIVRPAARARSTVLLTIPEQRESGLEDSMTESTDNSLCEDALQTHTSNTQEGQAVEKTLKLELVRGARRSRAPQTNTHINGDALSVFDDSTLSDVSDDEGRSPSSGQQQNENTDEMELAEEFDELTQSSDTATDDLDSPTSGYRHASLLIQKLDSATLDSRSMVKLQNIFHEYERSIQKARSRHGYLTDKVNQLEMERSELKSSLEEVKDFKSALERNQLELQTEVTNLKFQLKQEQENRRNATMMYNTTRDKLRRTEEQHQLEVQERQKVELALRNLELEMRTLVNNIKQLEEEHRETQRVLAQERSARTLQENLLNSHLRKQQEIDEENKRNISRSNEALSQLTEVSDRERELLQQTATLHEQLTILRTDLERSQANSSLKASHIMEENEALKEQLEDARRDLKLNSEALTQTVFNYNNQVTNLKSELAMITNRLENDRQTREALELEVESTRSRLAGTVKEAERCLAAHADTEKCLLREKEEHQRLKDRLTGDAASQRETVSSLSQKLAKAEACSNSMENEVHRVTLQLTEKGLLLEVLQREKDQAASRVKELEMALQAERELVSRSTARQGATQELLAQAQSQCMLLRQQLEEAQNKGVAKERAVTDAQDRFSDILSKLRSDCEERVQLVEERNKELASKAADLRDQIYKLEEEKNERETSLRQLQQELADSLKKLSMSEASLEVNTRYRNDLEEEKARLLKDMDRLKGKLEESEEHFVQAERRINSLKSSVDEREREVTTAAQKLQEALSSSTASDTTVKQLEEAVQRLEIENARLEAATKQQSNKIDALQKGAQEGTMMEIEKKKAKKVAEQKKAVDTRLDQEMKRNTDLQKEMYRLRTLLKTAKKKLRDQDTAGAEFGSPMSSLRMDLGRHSQAEGGYGRMKEKVDNLQVQLEKEASRRSQLEEVNGELKDQLASLKRFAPSTDQLERSKRQLEEEVLDLRRQMETAQMEPSHVEQCRREAEERARQEIQQKLEQVNLFLQSQAASQEALDQIRMANEAKLRSQLEQKIRELEGEVGRARTTQHDSLTQRDSTRTELERYRQLYTEELHLRKSMTAKLERANRRLAEANSKLLNERSRSFITSSIANGSLGSPALDVGTSPANYGATLGPLNRGLGLGLSILRPVTDTQNSRVEDYLAKVQSELDRNISKELNNATAELDVASARLSPVGSVSRSELDPVSRATQQYLEVLKKNNMI